MHSIAHGGIEQRRAWRPHFDVPHPRRARATLPVAHPARELLLILLPSAVAALLYLLAGGGVD